MMMMMRGDDEEEKGSDRHAHVHDDNNDVITTSSTIHDVVEQLFEQARVAVVGARMTRTATTNNNNNNINNSNIIIIPPAAAAADYWRYLHTYLLTPDHHSFAVHRHCFERVYQNHDTTSCCRTAIDTAPLWYPPPTNSTSFITGRRSTTPTATTTTTTTNSSSLTHCEIVMEELGLSSYDDLYRYSITKRNAFWCDAANVRCAIVWETVPTSAFGCSTTSSSDNSNNNNTSDTYFPQGRLNIVDSCLKPPPPNHHNKPALIFQRHGATTSSTTTASTTTTTVLDSWDTATLTQWVDRVAHRLSTGVGRFFPSPVPLYHDDDHHHQDHHHHHHHGSTTTTTTTTRGRIAVCLPLTPESIAIYLAIIKAGYTVVAIADSFSAEEIAVRCTLANVTVIFTQDVIWRSTSTTHQKTVPLYTRVVDAVESLVVANKVLSSTSSASQPSEKDDNDDDDDEKEHKEEEDNEYEHIDAKRNAIDETGPRRIIPIIVLPALLGSQDYPDHDIDVPLQVSLAGRPCDMSWADFLRGSGGGRSSEGTLSSSNEMHSDQDDDNHGVVVFDSVIGDAMTECTILFSSGTTGPPKAIVWTHATLIKCAVDGYYHQNLNDTDVICWPTSLGWMMGSWLIAQRINQVTIALPCITLPHDWPSFSAFLQQTGVTMLGVIPSLVSVWYGQYHDDEAATTARSPGDASPQKEQVSGVFRLPDSITRYSSTGEASDPLVYHWLMSRKMGYAPIIEYCGGTEIGGSFLSSVLCLPNVASHFNTPVLGSQLALLHPESHEILDNVDNDGEVRGELVLVPPTVGYSTVLLNRNHDECYFGGMPEYPSASGRRQRLRRHGDAFSKITRSLQRYDDGVGADESGTTKSTTTLYRALGRCDDTMNLGGIKVSSVELERVCNDAMAEICDCAAIAIGHPSKLVVYAVVVNQHHDNHNNNNNNTGGSNNLTETATVSHSKEVVLHTLQQSIKQRLNPLFHLRDVVLVDSLPRTASNKVMRRLLRDEYLQRQQQEQ